MTLDLTCQKCESSFELDAQELIDGSEKLACPHCNAKAPASLTDDLVSALSEIRAQISAISSRFAISLNVESEDLEDELDADEEDVDEDEDDGDAEEDDSDDADDELEFDEDDDEDEDYDDEDSED